MTVTSRLRLEARHIKPESCTYKRPAHVDVLALGNLLRAAEIAGRCCSDLSKNPSSSWRP